MDYIPPLQRAQGAIEGFGTDVFSVDQTGQGACRDAALISEGRQGATLFDACTHLLTHFVHEISDRACTIINIGQIGLFLRHIIENKPEVA